jgi:hypothetical protein
MVSAIRGARKSSTPPSNCCWRRTSQGGVHQVGGAACRGNAAVDPAKHVRGQELVMVGEMPVERSARLILLLYLDKRGRPKVRIHSRPRSDRKKRFLLSAVAPSMSTRHPRKARPINWAQRGGLASGREMSPDAEATFHRASCTLGNQVLVLRTAFLFVRSAVRLVYAELPERVAVCSPKQALCELGDRVPGWRPHR